MKLTSTEQAILQTLHYSAVFSSGALVEDCWSALISAKKVSKSSFNLSVRTLENKGLVFKKRNVIGLTPSLVSQTQSRLTTSVEKQAKAERWLKLVAWIPWIQAMGITGSVAARNAKPEDDIDLIILTKCHRLWLTRTILIGLLLPLGILRTGKSHKLSNLLCFNLWLDEYAFKLEEQSLYIAREIVQIRWVTNKQQTVQSFLSQNQWILKFLPNIKERMPRRSLNSFQKESGLPQNNRIINAFNVFAFKIQRKHMESRLTREKVGLHKAFFHPQDLEKKVLKRYRLLTIKGKRYNHKRIKN